MSVEKETLIKYLEHSSKLIALNSEYVNDLADLEEKDPLKFEQVKGIINNPDKLIQLIDKDKPELAAIISDILLTFGSIMTEKNPLEISSQEKKEQALRFENASKKLAELAQRIKSIKIKDGE
jgi:hypothetical protein